MSTYPSCPNCGHDDDGDKIWTCRSCGYVHCENCDEDNGGCPNCDDHGGMKISGCIDSSSCNQRTSHGSSYSACPRCGKNDEGDSIWECGRCGCEHCEDCDSDNGRCPSCGSSDVSKTGTIE